MATIGTQSFSRLVSVRKNKLGEAVDLRQALADVAVGERVLDNFRFITPQLDALRAVASGAFAGGAIALAGAGGTGKSSVMYTLARLFTVDYPSSDFTQIGDCLRDVYLVRSMAALRTNNRHWLLALPDFSNGDFVYAMRGAINGALLSLASTSEFVPKNGTLVEEYAETAEFLKRQGDFDGLLILGDKFEAMFSACLAEPQGDNAQNLREFNAFCASCPFPVLFVAAVERDLSSLSVEEEDFLLEAFQKVQPLTLLGRGGEWEDVVANYVLEHPDGEDWAEAMEYRDFHTVAESTVHQGLFAGNSEKWLNDMVVCGAYPLHPAALFALPRIAMNLSSSAKTAFRFFTDDAPGGLAYFLNNYAVVQPNGRLHLYTADWLCTYFEKVIQKDPHNSFYTSALQAAILAAGDVPQSRRIMRLIMIMQLIGHDRLRPQADTIVWALHLGSREERIVRQSLELLVQKKALEYSESTKEYLLRIPRQEVNVPQAIQRNRNRMRAQIDLCQELQSGLPTLRVRACGYNKTYYTDRCGIIRAYQYTDIQDTASFFEQVEDMVGNVYPYRGDVLFAIVIPNSEEEMRTVLERIRDGKYNHERLVMVVPQQAYRFAKDILEVRTLERMLSLESPFSDSTTAAHAQASKMLDRVNASLNEYSATLLEYENMQYFYRGNLLEFNSDTEVEDWLDERMAALVGTPPIIASTDLMCFGDSGVARRHRQRLVAYLMATRDSIAMRSDVRDIRNMVNEGLVKTSILRETGKRGFWSHYELNDRIPDEGLGRAFNAIVAQIKATGNEDSLVVVSSLLRPWLSAPNALTPALMEMLLAVVLWRWPREVCLFKNNLRAQAESRPELLQAVPHSAQAVADMVADSADWAIGFCEADPAQRCFLQAIFRIAGAEVAEDGTSLWVQAAQALMNWYAKLPPVAREMEVIKTRELQKFNRFFVMMPKQANRWREAIEVQLPRMLGAQSGFSWEMNVEALIVRLEQLCTEFAQQGEVLRQNLLSRLAQVFAGEDAECSWSEGSVRWLKSLPQDAEPWIWQVEFDALRQALSVPDEEKLACLLAALGYAEPEVWKQDFTLDVVERLEAMRKAVEEDKYCRGYRQSEATKVAVQLCVDVLRTGSLSADGAQDMLDKYIQALTWPESFDISPEQVVVPGITVANATVDSIGDWLYDDYIDVFKGIAIVDDNDAGVVLNGEEWPLGGGDILASVEAPTQVVVEAPAPVATPKDKKAGFSLAALVSGFTKARANEPKAQEAEGTSSLAGGNIVAPVEDASVQPVSPAEKVDDVDLSAGVSFAQLGFMNNVQAASEDVTEPEQDAEAIPPQDSSSGSSEELDEVTLEWL